MPFDQADYTADYWWQNIRNVVRFKEGIEQCANADIFVEIAPHVVLGSNIASIQPEALVLHSAHRKEDSARRFLATVAKLHFAGAPVNFATSGTAGIPRIPRYAWNRKTFFQEPTVSRNRRQGLTEPIDVIKFSPNTFPYVRDHIVGDKPILPTVTYIDLIHRYILRPKEAIAEFTIHTIYDITAEPIEFRVVRDGDKCAFLGLSNGVKYLSFRVLPPGIPVLSVPIQTIGEQARELMTSPHGLSQKQLLDIIQNKDFNFKEKMTVFQEAKLGTTRRDILVKVEPVKTSLYRVYPPVMDSCLLSVLMLQGITNNYQYLPHSIARIEASDGSEASEGSDGSKGYTSVPAYVYTLCKTETRRQTIYDSYIFTADFALLATFQEIVITNVTSSNTQIYLPVYQVVPFAENGITVLLDGGDLLKIRDVLAGSMDREVVFLLDIADHPEAVGFIRTCMNEHAGSRYRVCYFTSPERPDLTSPYPPAEYREVYYRAGQFHEVQLERYAPPVSPVENFYLSYTNKGSLQNTKFRGANLSPLAPGEVLIGVKATGVNFKDLAVMYDWVKDTNLGYECAGTVLASQSPNFAAGDAVLAMGQHCYANKLICADTVVWHKPAGLSFSEAAGVGLSYGTAYLALIHFANLTAEDTVLIHSATGALGLAAMEICKYIGCSVIVTAGSGDKRDYLKGKTPYVTDSRNAETYTRDVLAFTSGEGVDVVLASTVGEFLEANLALLKPGGKYLDVGKKLIYAGGTLPLKFFLKSIQYHSVHFDELLRTTNGLIRSIVNEILHLLNENRLAVFPLNVYPISEVKQVFQEFAKSQHTGKYVVELPAGFDPGECLFPERLFSAEKYYLITGGLGGLGEKLMEWMEGYGARKFLITSRTGGESRSPRSTRTVLKTNLLDQAELARLIEPYDIDGVFHLAGLISDKWAKDLTAADLPEILAVKMQGIENLGAIFKAGPAFFVAFSSIVALIGNPGQSLYAAANSYMDAYCQRRQAQGLPALSVNLGAIGGCGMIGRDYTLAKTMMANGINFTVYHDFFESLKHVLCDRAVAQVCITDQDWNQLGTGNRMFRAFTENTSASEAGSNGTSIEGLTAKLDTFLRELLDVDPIQPDKNLISYGVDSIMSMEIANWCRDRLQIPVKQIDILQGITVNQIIGKLGGNPSVTREQTVKNVVTDGVFSFTATHGVIEAFNIEDTETKESNPFWTLAGLLAGFGAWAAMYYGMV